jgi:hypothetical protein
MGENKIKVSASTTSKAVRVNVNTPSSQGAVTLSPDTSAYNANISEQWAISENIVLGKDYSSKYYANKAKESANNAQGFANSTKQTYNAFLDSSVNANNELVATRDEALTAINDRFEEGIGDGINQITVLVDNSIAEYTEISNQIKQDNSEASKLAQDWATSEVLVDNLDYSAKYYAEKAKDNSGIFYDELADEDIDVEIISGEYVTKADLELGLNTKQDKGNYALKSEIPSITNLATKDELPTQVSELENDSNYATQTQVLQAIASIPQFKLSIVEALPTTGEKMTLYLVPKEGTNNDVYNEYIWTEQTTSFEHLGTTAVDLTDYVKNTDYASTTKGGVIRVNPAYKTNITSGGILISTPMSIDEYNTAQTGAFIAKGTLENVLTQYSKTVLTTEADYNALTTKDANTLYLIEE